ncbi:tryptophan-rich sensory protein [Planosporangium flavigriseum]|uniref:TspO and MBR related proteins n=2 Tax=Planosporangium flavigriseum TaxID=373681 RepID=A0A8J3LNY8_9ACTN|nr:TspO/MBR family protein [Planosporangium flavigriseum]NJC66971.1 tryptophan-rich sensory protein [Planosporangium flavigriseum]GIG73963.1 hypothetical protein Pfl04_23670 [Planosporangium flavigriseum]
MADTQSRLTWYTTLDRPRWRPPPAVLGAAWTPLYALTMVAGARVLDRTAGAQRRPFARAYAASLVLGAAWSALFFGARSPRLALADAVVLNAANVSLLRHAWRADRLAAVELLPYVGWMAAMTAVTAAVATR